MIVFEVDFINQYSMIEKHYCDYDNDGLSAGGRWQP